MAALEPALTHQHFTLEPPWSLWYPLGAPQLHPLLAMEGLATTWCTWHPPNLSFTSTVNAARAWTGGTTGCGSASTQGSAGAKGQVLGSHWVWPGPPGSLVLPWLCSTARHRGPMGQGPPESASGTSASGWCWIWDPDIVLGPVPKLSSQDGTGSEWGPALVEPLRAAVPPVLAQPWHCGASRCQGWGVLAGLGGCLCKGLGDPCRAGGVCTGGWGSLQGWGGSVQGAGGPYRAGGVCAGGWGLPSPTRGEWGWDKHSSGRTPWGLGTDRHVAPMQSHMQQEQTQRQAAMGMGGCS